MNQQVQKEVRFYEGSYQFKRDVTDLNIHEDYIIMILAKQYEYRPTQKPLWADVLENGVLVNRFKFIYNQGLTVIN
jgi:hypothetical protein